MSTQPSIYFGRLHYAPTTIFTTGAVVTAWIAHAMPGWGFKHEILHFGFALALAFSLLLALACLVVLAVQVVQREVNRTPLVPGLALSYASLTLATTLRLSPFDTFWRDQNLSMTLLFGALHYLLPALGFTVVTVALWALASGRPLGYHAYGQARLYTASPDAVKRSWQIPGTEQTKAAMPAGTESKEEQPAPFRYLAQRPRVTFAQLHGNDELKEQLVAAGQSWKDEGKNGVMLFGPPGTGKTAFAEGLASKLNLGFIKVTFGDMASKWINQSTEQLVQVFNEAKQQQPVMLFIDEVDSLLKERGGQGGYEEYERMVNTFLDKVVDVRGTGVLVVAATNFISRLDEAAIREGRFDHKIQVPLPDNAARRGLVTVQLAKFHCTSDDATLARLTRRWGGFNVPRLLACAEGACKLAREEAGRIPQAPIDEPGEPVAVSYDHYYRALRKIQGRKGGAPEGAKRLSEMFLDAEQSERLQSLAMQLADVDAVERMGGSAPKGVAFYGPPGTGKSATAAALAAECGWSFISRTGRELMDQDAIDKLSKEASDLRPAIVFIDEADDILGDRRLSGHKSATNELLILIDGAEGTLQDVVWIAATNHPESLDAAARRGGRFGTKIGFDAPSEATAIRLIEHWAGQKVKEGGLAIEGTAAEWARKVHPYMADMTPADMYQVLNAANNEAITNNLRNQASRTLTTDYIARAVAELKGHNYDSRQ